MEILLIALIIGLIPAMIAKSKGSSFIAWYIYGCLLFIIALPHSLIMRADQKSIERRQRQSGSVKCRHCAEMIKPDAKVCRYCGRDVQ